MTKTTIKTDETTIELTVKQQGRCRVQLGWDSVLITDPKTAAALIELLAKCTLVSETYLGGQHVLTPSVRKPTIELGDYLICDRDEVEAAAVLQEERRKARAAAAE